MGRDEEVEWIDEVRKEKEVEVEAEGAAVGGQGATAGRLLLRPRMRNITLDGQERNNPQTAATQCTGTHRGTTIGRSGARATQTTSGAAGESPSAHSVGVMEMPTAAHCTWHEMSQ